MLKTISAALLAASVIAAPALAAETAAKTTSKTATTAPVIKADPSQTKLKADAKVDTKAKTMNANAAIAPSQHHKATRSHRHHKVVSSKKTQPSLVKPTAATEKRS